jgi:hypothetical protein
MWSTVAVAIGSAAREVPPLLQATALTSTTLLLIWAWTRWRMVPIFAQDQTLLPGARLGLVFSVRLGLFYVAVTRTTPSVAVLLVLGTLLGLHALRGLRQGAQRRRALAGLLGVGMAVLGALLHCDATAALLGAAAGLVWALEQRLARDPRLAGCVETRVVFYKLIGAAVILPVASVVAGESWLVAPSHGVWLALLAQLLFGGVGLWLRALETSAAQQAWLCRVAPLLTVSLQAWIGPSPGAELFAASLLMGAAGFTMPPA